MPALTDWAAGLPLDYVKAAVGLELVSSFCSVVDFWIGSKGLDYELLVMKLRLSSVVDLWIQLASAKVRSSLSLGCP